MRTGDGGGGRGAGLGRVLETGGGGGRGGGGGGGLGRVLETLLTPRAVQAIESVRNRLCRDRVGEAAVPQDQTDPFTVKGDLCVTSAGGVVRGDAAIRRQEAARSDSCTISKSLSVLDSDDDMSEFAFESGGLLDVSRTETLETPVTPMEMCRGVRGWDEPSSWV